MANTGVHTMDVEAQVIGLVGELDAASQERVLVYLHARYVGDEGHAAPSKVVRRDQAARVGRVIKTAESEPVSVADAARLTSTQKVTIYDWIKAGKLKTTPGAPYRGGYQSLVTVAAVRALKEG